METLGAVRGSRYQILGADVVTGEIPLGHAALASLEEGLKRGLHDHDVGALLKLREEWAGVKVRLPKA